MATLNTIYKLSTAKLNARFEQHFEFAPSETMTRMERAEAIHKFETEGVSPTFTASDIAETTATANEEETISAGTSILNRGAVKEMLGVTSADYFFIKNNMNMTIREFVINSTYDYIASHIPADQANDSTTATREQATELFLAGHVSFRRMFNMYVDATTQEHGFVIHKAAHIAKAWLSKRTDRAVSGYINKVRQMLADDDS